MENRQILDEEDEVSSSGKEFSTNLPKDLNQVDLTRYEHPLDSRR